MIVPTFDDSRRMSVVDQRVGAARTVRVGVRLLVADADARGHVERRCAARSCRCSIAVAIVISLFVEPGSKRSVSGWFLSPRSARAACAGSPSLAPCTVAIASTSPVCTSTIDGHAALGGGRGHLVDERRSTWYCSAWSIVSTRSVPLRAAIRRAFGVGDVAAALVALDDDLAGRALQLVVVERLEPVEAVALAADVADDRRTRRCPPGTAAAARARSRHRQGRDPAPARTTASSTVRAM